MKKVLIQGAMDIEADYFIKQVSEAPDYKVVEEDGFVFHCGTFANKYYIVNQTGMGTVKAAMATTYGIMRFHPTVVINQGDGRSPEQGTPFRGSDTGSEGG